MRKQRDGVGVQWIGDDDSFKIGGLTALHGIDFDMPEIVMASFSEAQRNRAAGSWLAAAILVRRTLEAVGRDLHPQHKNLFDCLNAMKTGGVISQEIWEWGTELRLLGNSAAHPGGDVVAAQDCEDAIHFLTAILRTLYELRPKFHAMRERRNK
jgi:hypothetical protein